MTEVPVLEAEVAEAARAAGLAPGDRVLVAVSGGADSAALASLLARGAEHGLPLSLTLGHVDHGWRGPAEAAADRRACEALAAALGVPLLVAPPPAVVRRTEDDARRHRYGALLRLATATGCRVVATAHHLRDQAETFLLRLRRGSGPAGLAGIPTRRPLAGGPVEVVRPLLGIDPRRLRRHLDEHGLAWREDPTNAVLDRDRVRVRARLLAAEASGAAWTRDLAATAERVRRALARREAAVEARCTASLRVHPLAAAADVALDDARAVGPRDADTLLRWLGAAVGADRDGPWLTRHHVEAAARLVARGRPGEAVALPRGATLAVRRDRLVLALAAPPPPVRLELRGDGAVSADVGAHALTLARRTVAADGFDAGAWARAHRHPTGAQPARAAFDADRLGPRVELAPVAPDDVLVPWGRTSSCRAYALLAREGVPAEVRRGVLALRRADGAIAWVVGCRIDAYAGVTATTKHVALVEVALRRR